MNAKTIKLIKRFARQVNNTGHRKPQDHWQRSKPAERAAMRRNMAGALKVGLTVDEAV